MEINNSNYEDAESYNENCYYNKKEDFYSNNNDNNTYENEFPNNDKNYKIAKYLVDNNNILNSELLKNLCKNDKNNNNIEKKNIIKNLDHDDSESEYSSVRQFEPSFERENTSFCSNCKCKIF